MTFSLLEDPPYDPTKFVPISVHATVPNVLAAKREPPVASVQELIGYARANPGKIAFASQGSGSTSHLTASMFQSIANVQPVLGRTFFCAPGSPGARRADEAFSSLSYG